MSQSDAETSRECEAFLCGNPVSHVFHDDMGVETEVCPGHAEQFPEDMLEVL